MAEPDPRAVDQVRGLARPLTHTADLVPLAEAVGGNRFVCLGEASHGTHEFYRWRAELSRLLVAEHGFTWIGVEGDWPDCSRLNRWVRGDDHQELDARGVLEGFERWPTWMWANSDVAEFLDWLRSWNLARLPVNRVGFYGLDVYSLWESLAEVLAWLQENAPRAVPAALRAWRCFVPYGEDPHQYARATRLVPESCEDEVVDLLVEVRRRVPLDEPVDEATFAVAQNAEVAAGAERYYRAMVRTDRLSWNLRDHHMVDTVDRLARHLGPHSKGLVWAHNTHVGDARATDMAAAGMVNVGELLRERHASEGVSLVGFAGHHGTVLAGAEWGAPDQVMPLPPARPGSHEDLLHLALAAPSVLLFPRERGGPWLGRRAGHRAVGVVYDPERELANYVPTVMGGRYDALLWFERTRALRPLHREPRPTAPELETEPSGF